MLNRSSNKICRKFSHAGTPPQINHLVANATVVQSWAKTIAGKATTPQGKIYSGQLTSLINYYNKSHDDVPTAEIDWKDWTSKIQTPELVSKVQANYESLMKEQYNVEAIAEAISTNPSSDYVDIVTYLGLTPDPGTNLPPRSLERLPPEQRA